MMRLSSAKPITKAVLTALQLPKQLRWSSQISAQQFQIQEWSNASLRCQPTRECNCGWDHNAAGKLSTAGLSCGFGFGIAAQRWQRGAKPEFWSRYLI
jgi:hypothetical protein